MFGLGVGELVLILVLAVLFFGSKKIPELAKGMGKAVNEFKKGRNENNTEDNTKDNDKDA
ncbi:MAG: twin-arginine translocase TatA/TatE family subunit [Alphaproteobacteria bacterium]|nr:MAG: twin-arginine translocase TatA/TatE family subunit [Alphaproteobacteria bacterium]